jgi:transposase-like protein
MDSRAFVKLLEAVSELTVEQRRRLLEQLTGPGGARVVIRTLTEGPSGRPGCPHCGAADPKAWGQSHGLPRYRCPACQRTFNPLTGTPLARLRHKERWGCFLESLLDGQTVHKGAATCGVAPSTSFRWRQRFLALPAQRQAQVLSGIAEVDETFFLHSQKGAKRLQRKPRKRGGKATKRGRSDEQVGVLVARDRSGATVDAVLPCFNRRTVQAVLQPVLQPDALLCSDGYSVYRAFAAHTGIAHEPVNLRAGIRVRGEVFHIQHVNAYHSRLKQWLRRFHGVATQHLPTYLGWFRWLDTHPAPLDPKRFLQAAAGMLPINT